MKNKVDQIKCSTQDIICPSIFNVVSVMIRTISSSKASKPLDHQPSHSHTIEHTDTLTTQSPPELQGTIRGYQDKPILQSVSHSPIIHDRQISKVGKTVKRILYMHELTWSIPRSLKWPREIKMRCWLRRVETKPWEYSCRRIIERENILSCPLAS